MKHLLISIFSAQFCLLSAGGLEHNWAAIDFDSVALGDEKADMRPSVDFRILKESESIGLRCEIILNIPFTNTAQTSRQQLTVRLYRENGERVEPVTGNPLVSVGGQRNAFASSSSYNAIFPWGTKELSACWIEIILLRDVFFLELPYGFDQFDFHRSKSKRSIGPPTLPENLKQPFVVGKTIAWDSVTYEPEVPNVDWRVSLRFRRLSKPSVELILYREEGPLQNGLSRWGLLLPRTSVKGVDSDDEVVLGKLFRLQLHEDGLRRSDEFWIGRPARQLRSYEKLEFQVGEIRTTLGVPSSLLRVFHDFSGGSRP